VELKIYHKFTFCFQVALLLEKSSEIFKYRRNSSKGTST